MTVPGFSNSLPAGDANRPPVDAPNKAAAESKVIDEPSVEDKTVKRAPSKNRRKP